MAWSHINLITSINNAGSVTKYIQDGYGNTNETIDPNQNPPEKAQYDALYRLTKLTDAAGNQDRFEYSRRDQMIKAVADNGATTSFLHNDFDEIISRTSPDTGTTTWTRDNAGNTITTTDARDITVQYTYDSLNRPLTATYPNTQENITYTWDTCEKGIGRLCQVTDASGTTEYTYDVYGNTLTKRKTELERQYLTTHTYDELDMVKTMTNPSGLTINYTRDARSRITGITVEKDDQRQNIISAINYRPDNKHLSMTYSNGLTETRAYDLQGRLTTQKLGTAQNTTSALSKRWQYDANGNATLIDDNLTRQLYTYDFIDRLTVERASANFTYTYDGNDNRTTKTSNGALTNYEYPPRPTN